MQDQESEDRSKEEKEEVLERPDAIYHDPFSLDPSAWHSTLQHGPHGASGAESAPSFLQTVLCTSR